MSFLAQRCNPAAPYFPFPSFPNCRCVKATSLSRPSQDHVEVTLQLNSFIIPYHISFLNPPWSFSHPCQHKGPYISLSSSLSSSSVHGNPSYTLNSPVKKKSLAPTQRPSHKILVTFMTNVSHTHPNLSCSPEHTRPQQKNSSEENSCTSLFEYP